MPVVTGFCPLAVVRGRQKRVARAELKGQVMSLRTRNIVSNFVEQCRIESKFVDQCRIESKFVDQCRIESKFVEQC